MGQAANILADPSQLVAARNREERNLQPSEDIKALFCDSLDAVGIGWTCPSNRQIAIYRKSSVAILAILDKFVGPKR